MEHLTHLQNTRIGVIGQGYLGSRLADWLEEYGGNTITISRITRETFDDAANRAYDYVVNCAGNTGDFREQVYNTPESNICLTTRILRTFTITTGYLGVSGTRIYGFQPDSSFVFDENYESYDDHRRLDYLYNGSKKLMENILLHAQEYLPYKVVAARPSNIYGRFSSDDLDRATFLKTLCEAARAGTSPEIKQNSRNTKDYIFIDDVIDGIMRALVLGESGDVFNIASGRSYSVREITDILGIKDPVFAGEDNEESHSRISIERAREKLGFSPQTSFEECISQQLLITS